MRLWTVLLAAFVLAACTPTPDDPLPRSLGGMRGELLVRADGGYTRNGVGSTVRLKDGRLLHLVSRHRHKDGVSPDHWPADIAAMTSSDEGRTWSPPRVVFRGPGPSAVQPGLARLKSGELGVFYSRISGPDRAYKVFRVSSDEGKTWSDEIIVGARDGYWTSAHDRLVTLSNGRLVIPLHTKTSVDPEQVVTRVAWSDDNGRTWKISGQVVNVAGMIDASRGKAVLPSFWEASIVERTDGSLLMLGRTLAGALYRTVSTDGGESWSEPVATSLVTGASPGRVDRLPDGSLLVVWNRCCLNPDAAHLGRRLTLSSAVSRDGGQTWGEIRDIEAIAPAGRVEYPAVLVSKGRVFIAYRALGVVLPPHTSQEYLAVLPVAWFSVDSTHHRPDAAIPRDLPSPTSEP